MRELSPETVKQLYDQLERTAVAARAEAASALVRDAMIEAVFLVAAADGKVTPLEIAQFADAVEAIHHGGPDGDADALVTRMAERLQGEGPAARMAAVEAALVGSEHREAAYRMAASVAFVDDTIEDAEAKVLDGLARGLGIADDRAHAIMDEVHRELFGD